MRLWRDRGTSVQRCTSSTLLRKRASFNFVLRGVFMSVVNIASSSSHGLTELDQDYAPLAASLSRRLTRVPVDGMALALSEALADIVTAIRVDGCRLIELSGPAASRVHFAAGATRPQRPSEPEDWLVDRLGRGEVVSVSRPEELPRDAIVSRERSRVVGPYSMLGVPVVSGGEPICALVIDGGRLPRRWAPTLVERLQLLAEILASALLR